MFFTVIFLITLYLIITWWLFSGNKIKIRPMRQTMEDKEKGGLYCYPTTGVWDGEKCNCKHPEFLTNNEYNGNCDKIVDLACKTINDENGASLDFNVSDPYHLGVCDCGDSMVYNNINRKCVLQTFGDIGPQRECGVGFEQSENGNCVKRFCYWDILNPMLVTDQKGAGTMCDCDFERGFLQIQVSDDIVGCTGSVVAPVNVQQHVMKFDNQLFHMYSESRVMGYFKSKLKLEKSQKLHFAQNVGNRLAVIHDRGDVVFRSNDVLQRLPIKPKTTNEFMKELIRVQDINTIATEYADDGKEYNKPFAHDGEMNSLRRYLHNYLYLGALLFDKNGVTINPEGHKDLYKSVMAYYFPEIKEIIITTSKD